MSDPEDEQIKRAIALSLQPPRLPASLKDDKQPSRKVVDLTADSDEDVDAAMRPTQSDEQQPTPMPPIDGPADPNLPLRDNLDQKVTVDVPPETQQQSRSAFGVLGLDRKRMEEERLARLESREKRNQNLKRKASISPPPLRKDPKLPKTAEVESRSTAEVTPIASQRKSGFGDPATPEEAPLVYPNGVVKKTWAFGHQRNDDIKIEEVLQKDSLELAVLSSYKWDIEWLLSKLRVGATDLVLVMEAKDEDTVSQHGALLQCELTRL